MLREYLSWSSACGLVAVLAACSNAGGDLGPGPTTTNAVTVNLFLDRDGSLTYTPLDTVFAGARVALLISGSSDTLKAVTSNSVGTARFDKVPLGQYRVTVVPASIGDSIEVQQIIDSANIRVRAVDTNTVVLIRLGYPEVSIREARALPAGKRVFIRGKVLGGALFRDSTTHVADTSGQIRLTRVSLRGGLTTTNPGDSVSVIGETSSRAGQPTLDEAAISKLSTRPPPQALAISSGTAANANIGLLDAALVQVTSVLISDTSTVAPDFRVVASDGSGDLTIILDGNLNFVRSNFRPGRSIIVKGLLVPDGQGGWVLKPRDLGDVTLL
ncbi:MAG TPA: hypothetical protein VGQ69_13570 [Gemmatimonadales bacterium]|nr:hypothetical protein [Gemmatimonadales bacterium]